MLNYVILAKYGWFEFIIFILLDWLLNVKLYMSDTLIMASKTIILLFSSVTKKYLFCLE